MRECSSKASATPGVRAENVARLAGRGVRAFDQRELATGETKRARHEGRALVKEVADGQREAARRRTPSPFAARAAPTSDALLSSPRPVWSTTQHRAA